jgi:hypothetical protein
MQLDVHTQVVGIQLEFVAWQDAAIFLNIQRQSGDFAIHTQGPMAVLAGVGLVINFEIGHADIPLRLCIILQNLCQLMQYIADI